MADLLGYHSGPDLDVLDIDEILGGDRNWRGGFSIWVQDLLQNYSGADLDVRCGLLGRQDASWALLGQQLEWRWQRLSRMLSVTAAGTLVGTLAAARVMVAVLD